MSEHEQVDSDTTDAALDSDVSNLLSSKEQPATDDIPKTDWQPANPQAEQQKSKVILEYEEILEPLWQSSTQVFCPSLGITDDQCKTLAQGWAPLLAKFFPDGASSPEMQAGLSTFSVFAPPVIKKYMSNKDVPTLQDQQ